MCKSCISTDSMITASLDVFKRSYKNEVLNSWMKKTVDSIVFDLVDRFFYKLLLSLFYEL